MKTRSRIFGVLAAGALAATVNVAGVETAQAAGIFHPIKNAGNSMCLQPQGGSIGEVSIVQATCNGGLAQNWGFFPVSGSIVRVVNQFSGHCMYMNGPVASRSPVAQVPCGTVSNYSWQPSSPPPSVGTLKSRAGNATTLCLDVPGRQSTEGLPVQIYTCNGTPAQAWAMGF